MRRVLVAVHNPQHREAVIAALTTNGFNTMGTTPTSLFDRFRHMVEFGVEPDVIIADLTTDATIVNRHLAHLYDLGHRPHIIALTNEPHTLEPDDQRRNLPPNTPGWQIAANIRELVGIAPGDIWT